MAVFRIKNSARRCTAQQRRLKTRDDAEKMVTYLLAFDVFQVGRQKEAWSTMYKSTAILRQTKRHGTMRTLLQRPSPRPLGQEIARKTVSHPKSCNTLANQNEPRQRISKTIISNTCLLFRGAVLSTSSCESMGPGSNICDQVVRYVGV